MEGSTGARARGPWLASLVALVLVTGCGRLGFAEQRDSVQRGGARDETGLHDAAAPLADASAHATDASDPANHWNPEPDASMRGPDAGLAPHDASSPGPVPDDAGSVGDAALPPPAVDPACNPAFPVRMWPVASDVASCTDNQGITWSTTGPGSADYTLYDGCSSWLEFATTPDVRIEVRAFGDGCVCVDCSLWHVHYALQEDLGGGLETMQEVQEPDAAPCPNGNEVNNYTSYRPRTGRVRLQTLPGTTGSGFYFVVCVKP